MAPSKQTMNNPHEEVQSALLSRIVNNMKSLNESVHDMNLTFHEINNKNKEIQVLAQMWQQYSKNTEFNIEATGQRREPL